jgi:hypothetical protein
MRSPDGVIWPSAKIVWGMMGTRRTPTAGERLRREPGPTYVWVHEDNGPCSILRICCAAAGILSKPPSHKRGRYWIRTSDLFRVRAEHLPGNADKCGVWSVC